MIELKAVWVRYPDGVYGLRGVDLRFEGGLLAVLGPNGSGKSTFKSNGMSTEAYQGLGGRRGSEPMAPNRG